MVDPRGIPDQDTDRARFGAWVENACLAHAWSAGQRVTYWREEPMKVDGVIDGSWGRWAIEVKTGAITQAGLRGLSEFVRRHSDYRPLVLCDPVECAPAARMGLEAMPWPDYLLKGLQARSKRE